MDDRDPLPHMAELERSQQTESEMRVRLEVLGSRVHAVAA